MHLFMFPGARSSLPPCEGTQPGTGVVIGAAEPLRTAIKHTRAALPRPAPRNQGSRTL